VGSGLSAQLFSPIARTQVGNGGALDALPVGQPQAWASLAERQRCEVDTFCAGNVIKLQFWVIWPRRGRGRVSARAWTVAPISAAAVVGSD